MTRPYPIPDNEAERLERLRYYKILDTKEEESFDRITRLATHIMGTPIALISLMDKSRQWFKSRKGLNASETPRDLAFCAHAIITPKNAMVVQDATKDKRFFDNPLVTESPNIRFYAGVPLTTDDGLALGTLCAIDSVPREPTPEQMRALSDLARVVLDELELRRAGLYVLDEVAHRKQLDEMKSAFIADVNHELRTPLTSIIGSLGLLESGALGEFDDTVMELLRIADRNSKTLLELINDLLDMSKLEAGAMQFDFSSIDIVEVMREVTENVATYAVDKKLTLNVDADQSAITINGDKRRLIQAVTNLVSNAIKFSPQGGTVHVRAYSSPSGVRVEVQDHGPGIPKSEQQKLFGKFIQAKTAETINVKGTGLGLSIAKSIVESHAGHIGVESDVGHGTTFFFELPSQATLLASKN
jgi:signal transduction histidine kinase